ncbi:MAG: ABC transporter ATP-binding protein [Actinomycetota bacterium]|nr:ABC transporter ATP-binding protein [Actinomycetota bacterium]
MPKAVSGTVATRELWKRFRVDSRRSMLSDELVRLRGRLRGESPTRWRWALSDVNLSVNPGEAVGLVGTNGSGKSTLLKILTRVMYPYAGRVEVSGRVGALIEVSAGIHPQLTGRENIYLYGSLLGLSRNQVAKRFDEIVGFAEVNAAVDRQVKFYSSGMKMRIGFAVAAFLEPDVLLVDEVLAVGDASFQQKCLDRMRSVIAGGTTLIFVSHDLASVESTCRRGVWLSQGTVQADGPIGESLGSYRRSIEETAERAYHSEGLVNLLKVSISGEAGAIPCSQGPLEVSIVLENERPRAARLFFGLSEGPAAPTVLLGRDLQLETGQIEARCSIARLPLPRGRFYLWIGVFARDRASRDLLSWHPAAHFDVVGPDLDLAPSGIVRLAPVAVDARWEIGTP